MSRPTQRRWPPPGLTALIVAAAALFYRLRVRRWILNSGATPAEAASHLPGDDLLPDADVVATRAISIDAPPSAVFPWLVQMGPGRGGAYTYDWIENLFGLNMHSADRIVPEWQNLAAGDVGIVAPGAKVAVLDADRALVIQTKNDTWVWALVLEPSNGGTRLISRNRFLTKSSSASARLAMALMEPGSLVMERKMLRGIKQRAERLHREAGPSPEKTLGRRATGPASLEPPQT
jgi:hypothetical protein